MSFSRYNIDDSVISSEVVVRSLWDSGNTLSSFFTSSVSSSINPYYTNVFSSVDYTVNPVFSFQYGHKFGSGSAPINSLVSENTPTRINYGQYRSLIYNDENAAFVFGNITSDDFIAINLSRACYKDSISPGSLTLELNGTIKLSLTDDSIINNSVVNYIGSNRYYTLISGSNGVPSNSLNGVSGSYGLLFPDLGVIILNPKALQVNAASGGLGLNLNPANTIAASNANRSAIFNMIKGTNNRFIGQSEEVVSSRYFFTRVKNAEFNYTTNPSIINASGSLIYDNLIYNPQTYITTVGLYNDNNELLAVAKLSKPLVKDFTKEAYIKVRLDY